MWEGNKSPKPQGEYVELEDAYKRCEGAPVLAASRVEDLKLQDLWCSGLELFVRFIVFFKKCFRCLGLSDLGCRVGDLGCRVVDSGFMISGMLGM